MYCGGSHLGFPIGIKNIKFVEDLPMIIPGQFGWNVLYQVSVFYADRKSKMAAIAGHRLTLDPMGKCSNSQSEHIIGPGSHIEYPTGTKNSNFVEDHPRNIPAKFGSNRPSGSSLIDVF
jgi:hypothetical protein